MAEESKAKRQPPKGGRKGGSVFPRYSLENAIDWAQKLVSKTHLKPVPKDIVEAGVVESKSGVANMKISAMKQFGLLEGTAEAYQASDLAKKIVNAPEEDSKIAIGHAAIRPNIFKGIFEAFQGGETSVARVRQRATDLQVHPDSADECVARYIDSLSYAGLVQRDGDKLIHKALGEQVVEQQVDENLAPEEHDDTESEQYEDAEDEAPGEATTTSRSLAPQAVFNVQISLDSSLDTDKLENQLKLLKKFRVIK